MSPGTSESLTNVTWVACSRGSIAGYTAVVSNGKLYIFGDDFGSGSLGRNNALPSLNEMPTWEEFNRVKELDLVIMVACGDNHTVVLTSIYRPNYWEVPGYTMEPLVKI